MRALRFVAAASLALTMAACAGAPSEQSTRPVARQTGQTTANDLSSFGHLPPVPQATGTTVSCAYARAGESPRPAALPRATTIPATGTTRVTLSTNLGSIGLTLNRNESPCTVNSFTSLVAQRFFDNTACHRLSTATLHLLQCGDPTGTGRGGPGYLFPNEYPTTTYAANNPAVALPVVYPRGTVAMANDGTPGTNGSQFFMIYADSPLPPLFTVFGTIDPTGVTIIDKVAAAGDDGSLAAAGGRPRQPTRILTTTAAS